MAILEEIITWGKGQDIWLQDALARLLKNGNYTHEDVQEVAELLLLRCEIIEETSVTPMALPLFESTTDNKAEHKKIILKKIHSLKNINALTENGGLEFAEKGLTIIYGTNGSGKSGYSRVLKKCCRARSVEDILPYAFKEAESSEEATSESEATIDYAEGDGSGYVDDNFTWKDSVDVPAAFKQIWVYDKGCGKIQIKGKNEFAYVPAEAQIFEKLVTFVENVREEVKGREPQEVRVDFSGIQEGTTTHSIITDINNSDDTKIIEEKLKNITWNDEKEKELLAISKKLLEANKTSVEAKIEKIEQEISSIRELKDNVKEMEALISQGAVSEYQVLAKERKEARTALDKISEDMSKQQHISGTGNELWRTMYEAAKEFAADKLSHDHKYIHIDERCVLCQQILDDEAKKRMQSFSEFANDKVKKRLDDLNEKKSSFLSKLADAEHKIDICHSKISHNLEIMSDNQRKEITSQLKEVEKLCIDLISFLKNNNTTNEINFLKNSASNIIERILKDANSRKEEVKKNLNIDAIERLEAKKREIESNKAANSKKDQINKRVKYLQVSKKYRVAIEQTNTTAISSAARELINMSISDSFLKALSDELSHLGGNRLKLSSKPSTVKGKPTYEMSLEGTKIRTNIEHVFSEGEQNIASLAGFLAEIKMSGHKHGIIFDDPVASLDHLYREKVAERLVKEAKGRQVIIFTHDLVFLFELLRFSSELKPEPRLQSLHKSGNKCGEVKDSPWEALNVKERIKKLDDDVCILKNLDINSEEYSEKSASICNHIRETWERLVEEVLLNGVVTRFEKPIKTKQLNAVCVEDKDYKEVYYAMEKLSEFTGHDRPPNIPVKHLSADEMQKELEKVRQYLKDTNRKKEDLKKRRKPLTNKSLENML